ncbi:MAG: hypothetical protein K2M96_08115 [Prevotella sp.]|nr:hypothetical protein [Prevotella sp.]
MKNFYFKSALMLTMLLFPQFMNAQEEEIAASSKTTIFFESSGTTAAEKAVRNAVMTTLTNFKRLIVLDAESEAVANVEDIRRTAENITAGSEMVPERLNAVVRLGAQSYFLMTVDNVNCTTERNDNSSAAKCKIIITVKVIDPSESKVLAMQQMNFSGSDANNNEEEAFNRALKSITEKGSVLSSNPLSALNQNPLMQFIENEFPIMGQILEINEAKKDKAVTVYINAGSDNGVIKNTKFEVFKEKKVGTRTASVKIGELTANDIQGGDLTLCKVSKDGDAIFKEFNNGTTLKVKSRAKKDRPDLPIGIK